MTECIEDIKYPHFVNLFGQEHRIMSYAQMYRIQTLIELENKLKTGTVKREDGFLIRKYEMNPSYVSKRMNLTFTKMLENIGINPEKGFKVQHMAPAHTVYPLRVSFHDLLGWYSYSETGKFVLRDRKSKFDLVL